MNSDKNSAILEKQLKTLGQKIRIDILKALSASSNPLSFSSLQKELFYTSKNLTNFSFHLKSLKNINLITSFADGWVLTSLGKKIIEQIISIEQVIEEQEKTLMIRTSKYSKEPFNVQKIQSYLVIEGGMEIADANNIAKEVKDRLFKTKIEYLTAPLMREYINGILLERGFESVRHELTRLGTPPHEVRRLMAMNQYNHAPDKIIYQLGSDVSEQFLLLNVLPNYLADSYLSGELALLQLNYWWLRPLGFFLDTKTLLNENVLKRALQTNNKLALMSLLTSFLEYLFQISPFYSQDLLIGNFNTEFISVCDSLEEEKKKMFFDILARQFNHFNVFHNINNSRLALEFTTHEMDNIKHTNSKSNELILDQLNQCLIKPFIFYDYTNLDLKLNPEIVQDNFIYYDGLSLSLINSLIVNVRNSRENQENSIILDKILINLQEIAMQASYSDNRFHDLVQEKLDLVFDLFRCKSRLMQKNLNSNKEWIKLINTVFKWRSKDWINEAIKSVSFYGLNEAIKHHCGIEMDRIDKSEAFAINILKLLKNLIKEKNENEGEKYVLGQPHQGNYLNSNNEDSKSIEYETSIVRTDSNLRLEQKITMFKRFERILSGGALFNHNSSSNENIFEIFKILSNSKLSAFSINGNLV